MKRFWATYTHFNMRASDEDNNLNKLRQRLQKRMNYPHDHYAIFHQKQDFHSTTQQKYLVEHYNDTYFINTGIPSTK